MSIRAESASKTDLPARPVTEYDVGVTDADDLVMLMPRVRHDWRSNNLDRLRRHRINSHGVAVQATQTNGIFIPTSTLAVRSIARKCDFAHLHLLQGGRKHLV